MACCPAHDDRAPSLSITDATGGKVLVRCHAGCDQRDVIAALRAARSLGRQGQGGRPICAQGSTAGVNGLNPTRRPEAQRGGAGDLAGIAAGRGNAGRRPICARAGSTFRLPPDLRFHRRAEASLGRHLAGDGGAGDARRRRNADRHPPHLPRPRRRRQGAGRSAEDDARPLPRRRGAPRRAGRRADGRRRHRDLPRRHAGDRTSGLGGAFDLGPSRRSICRATCAT